MTPVGRPRKIDPEDALARALDVFWEKGYESTSMSDLVCATGMHKGSLYKAFGDKESLFLLSLESYTRVMELRFRSIAAANAEPLETLKRISREVIEIASGGEGGHMKRGCLVLKTLSNISVKSERIQAFLNESNLTYFEFMHTLVAAAGERYELAGGSESVTRLLMATMTGLTFHLQGSVTKEQALVLVDKQFALLFTKK